MKNFDDIVKGLLVKKKKVETYFPNVSSKTRKRWEEEKKKEEDIKNKELLIKNRELLIKNRELLYGNLELKPTTKKPAKEFRDFLVNK